MLFNLRRVVTGTTGTGTMTLGAAVAAYKNTTDAPAIADQTWVTYAILDAPGGVGTNSEIGQGLYSTAGPTVTRNVIESTNSNNPISLSGSAQVFITPSAGDLQSNTAFPNRFRNGGMQIWQRGTSAITATTAGAYIADGWIVVPAGASVTAAQTTGRLLTLNSLLVTGATSVTNAFILQRIESSISVAMTSQQVTFQAWLYNNTGGAITPALLVKHPTAQDNFSSLSTDIGPVNLQSCANGAWTQISYTFAASSSSALGMEITLAIGNNLSTSGKSIQITECDLRVTPGVPSGINYIPPVPQFRPINESLSFCQRYFCKSYDSTVAPGSVSTNGMIVKAPDATCNFMSFNGTPFPVIMRAVPTLTIYNPNSGSTSASTNARDFGASADVAVLPQYQGDSGFGAYVNNVSVTAGNSVGFHFTASAEL